MVAGLTATNVHGLPLNPSPAPVEENVTIPPGAVAVPMPVSVTVAVQVVGLPTVTEPGEQLTAVEVGRTVPEILVLPDEVAWVLSPP